MNDKFKFIETQIKRTLENRAEKLILPVFADTFIETTGFGLARVKSEAKVMRYDKAAHLNYHSELIIGQSDYKLNLLYTRTIRYINKISGFHPWKTIFWRALPEFVWEKSFEQNLTYGYLYFRASYFDE